MSSVCSNTPFPQIGHFPMDPSTVATFELHLTIQVFYSFSSDLCVKMFPGKHGSDYPSAPDLDQPCPQDWWQTHTGFIISSSFRLHFHRIVLPCSGFPITFLENNLALLRFTLTPSSSLSRRSSTGPLPQTRCILLAG